MKKTIISIILFTLVLPGFAMETYIPKYSSVVSIAQGSDTIYEDNNRAELVLDSRDGAFRVGVVHEVLTIAGSRDARYNGRYGMLASGCTFLTLGCLATTACIPCLIIGGIKKNNSHEVYNEVCATRNRAALELDLQAGQDGLGLALKF